MPPSDHLISDLNFSQLRVQRSRREPTGQPATSLQANAKKYNSMRRPTVYDSGNVRARHVSDRATLYLNSFLKKEGLRSAKVVCSRIGHFSK